MQPIPLGQANVVIIRQCAFVRNLTNGESMEMSLTQFEVLSLLLYHHPINVNGHPTMVPLTTRVANSLISTRKEC
mgnify:CR=1 FL=1